MFRWLRKAFDAIAHRARFERDMRDELRLHIDERAHDLITQGLSGEDAARRARVEFGAIERYKEACRDARGFAPYRPFHGLWSDVTVGCRRLAATPQFLAFAALSLAIGIAVTTAVYSIFYSLVWKPLGIADEDRVVVVSAPVGGATMTRRSVSVPDFEDLRGATRSFAGLAASGPFYQNLVTPDASDAIEGEAVSGDYFRTLGVTAARGRTIEPGDDAVGARIMIVNYRLWQARFGGDPQIVGRVIRLGGEPFEIVGVAPRSFDGIDRAPRRTGAWIPLRSTSAFGAGNAAQLQSRHRRSVTVIGRLASGSHPRAVNAELASIAARLDADFPLSTDAVGDQAPARIARVWMTRGVAEASESDSRLAGLMVALVALVLVVACTNLANLMLARGAARRREIAVRGALGAGRWRLVRELLVEASLVAVLGGGLSLLLLRVLLDLSSVTVPLPGRAFSLEPEINLAAITVAAIAVCLSLFVFGLEPALKLTRGRVAPDLAGGDGTIGVVRSGRQRAFIRWQVATSVTFFLIASVLARVIIKEARHDPGIDVDRLAVASAYLPLQNWEPSRALRSMTAVVDLLTREPGIESAALATGAPYGLNGTAWAQAATPDKPFRNGVQAEITQLLASTPAIFRTLGVPIVRGRGFDDRDDAAAAKVMVVSEKTARTFFGTTDVVGRRLVTRGYGRPPDETWTIVGVARQTDSGHLMSRNNDIVYVPLAQHHEPLIVVFARTAGDPSTAAQLIQKSARRADLDVALGTTGPASIVLAGPYFAARVAAAFAGALGLLTLLLAMVGLYGVQAHLVAGRTREVGVRMAIGASERHIERMVLVDGFAPVLQGIGLGMLLALLPRLALRAFVDGNIQPIDTVASALIPLAIIAAAFAACYVPARRASRVDPNVALRHL